MIRTMIEFLADESGATAIGFSTIAALASVALVGAIDIFG
jgi:Flp pilus assembly pilin Flp